MIKEIVETIQPALEETVGPEKSAKVKVMVTPKIKPGKQLSQLEASQKSEEFNFNDTRDPAEPVPAQATPEPVQAAPAPVV